MTENEIRDRLATQLDLIEAGLTLVTKNYPLPNAVGSRGFVDILARDATGCFVIIELKRSDSTAREALHELAKYVELFQREKGLSSADVRTVIVSTVWRELLVPFSQAAREWSVNLRGYRLLLDPDDVTPIGAQEVPPLAEALTIAPTPIQLLVQSARGDLDAVWQWAAGRLLAVGAKNLLGFDLQHSTYEAGVYLVLGRMDPGTAEATALARLAEEDSYDLSDAQAGYELEYTALYYLCKEYVGFTLEHVGPHSLASVLQDPAWQLMAVRRSGAFLDELVFPDKDLIGASSTTGGLSDVRFEGAARVSHRQQWKRFIDRLQFALAGNELWSFVVTAWLNEVAESGQDVEVSGNLFNPCDLVSALVFGWPDQLDGHLPEIEIAAHIDGKRRAIKGCLVSVGTFRSASLAFEQTYRDVQEWWVELAIGEVWRSDLDFIRELGLCYAVFEWSDDYPDGAILEHEENGIIRRPPEAMVDGTPFWRGCEPLPDLIAKNFYDFQHLVLSLRQQVHRSG